VFDTGSQLIDVTPTWEWTRLETGEDVLLGPATITPTATIIARLGPGDIAEVVLGHST